MPNQSNRLVLHVATVNGSGSQSSNNVLARCLFRMGLPVGAKNLFPSNIAGLPTWFTIRVHPRGFTGRSSEQDIVIGMNGATLQKDIDGIKPGGIFIYNSDLKLVDSLLREDVTNLGVPFKSLAGTATDSVKLKKLLTNMVYVGLLVELLSIPWKILQSVVEDYFADKPNVIASNLKAIQAGVEYARENLNPAEFEYKLQPIKGGNKDKIFMDGNSAGALGLVCGGCHFVSWYPITPSSSLVENFLSFAGQLRENNESHANFAVVQAEDELSAISMVIGAGWAGARALTATSGPGLSLMAEAAGLSYYAEIPAVIWNVQRVGPSTGLPTRTMQGDLVAAYRLSHGDTKHVVLIPGTIEECFEFGQIALDLAERLQTLVIVLTDLDLGMNFHLSESLSLSDKNFDRGKVFSAQELEKLGEFERYRDVDGDGIPYRTLPGTEHPLASFFTRGTGHDESSAYSEDPATYTRNMDRLARKHETARAMLPAPYVDRVEGAEVALVGCGSTQDAVDELRFQLNEKNLNNSYLRIKALPLSKSIEEFIQSHKRVYVIDQNRDGQLYDLVLDEWPNLHDKLRSVRVYDGLPLEAREVSRMILKQEALL